MYFYFPVKDESVTKDDLDMDVGNNHTGENNLSDACFSDDEEDNVPLGKQQLNFNGKTFVSS